ncbi:hypothetical protein LJK87_46855 [Paenibacillus sp. P25]|nr:hypothetical protein LJK87_46855 [Paenibacillus sp. P25]
MGERPVCAAAGESYHQPPEWTQNPSVIVSGGSYNVAFDKQGAKKSLKRKAEDTPPTHPELQKTREKQGATYREMLKKNPQELPHIVKRLEDAAEGLENVTGDILPKNHAKKVKKEHDAGPISGSKFRGIVKGLDEFTQSEATSSFHKGARRRHGNTPPRDIPQVDRIVELSLRLQSADRAPTQTIYAPVDFQGNITGQQSTLPVKISRSFPADPPGIPIPTGSGWTLKTGYSMSYPRFPARRRTLCFSAPCLPPTYPPLATCPLRAMRATFRLFIRVDWNSSRRSGKSSRNRRTFWLSKSTCL